MYVARSTLSLPGTVPASRHCPLRLLLLFLASHLWGCADHVRGPTPSQLAAFREAGSARSAVDMEGIQKAKLLNGPYRVVPGDVLEFTMPSLLQAVTAAQVQAAQARAKDDQPYICRINAQGAVTLPAVGELEVAGESLVEIEEKVINAYRSYFVLRPSVSVRVREYKMYQVSIMGAVVKPGVYALRRDQMSLMALLMEAGGIINGGVTTIRIARTDLTDTRSSGPKESTRPQLAAAREERQPRARRAPSPQAGAAASAQLAGRLASGSGNSEAEPPTQNPAWEATHNGQFATRLQETIMDASEDASDRTVVGPTDAVNEDTGGILVVPVSRWNIPFCDVVLTEGDTIIVEQMKVPLFSVLGLVNRPGNFPYPPMAQYNLTQAIAFAEGLDPVADPRYATIYRPAKDGSVVRVPFKLIENGEFTEVLNTPIQPGDVVAIEHTPRTRVNATICGLLRINRSGGCRGAPIR